MASKDKKKTSSYIIFNNNLTVEFNSNNMFALKDGRGNIAYIDSIEYLVKKMHKWEMDKKLSSVQEIQLKDYLCMAKDTLEEIKQFFEDAFSELEKETVKTAKKYKNKKVKSDANS